VFFMGVCSAVSFGAQSAFAQVSSRPISLDAVAHEQGTVVLVRQPLDSVLIFLDTQDQLRWQRRLLPDEQPGVLLRGADSDRVCRARRHGGGGWYSAECPLKLSSKWSASGWRTVSRCRWTGSLKALMLVC
jgi:hypothetical protein